MSSEWDKEIKKKRFSCSNGVLEASKKIFLEKDVLKVTMKDIANEARISEGTLYEHYRSIDKIIFEVQQYLLLEMEEFFEGFSMDLPAYEQITVFLQRLLICFKTRSDIFGLQESFDHYYRTQGLESMQVCSAEDLIEKSRKTLHLLFVRGQNEGEIRNDIKVQELVEWSTNHIMAMVHCPVMGGSLLENETFISKERIMEMTVESIMAYVKKR